MTERNSTSTSGPWADSVPLREYVEAIFEEYRRALVTSEQEREKAARALREEMQRTIEAGDAALKDHIEAQVVQLKLLTDSVRREMQITYEAAEKAIDKAAVATEKRFESVNEWRAQSADRERSQAEQLALFTSEFIRLDVHKAEIAQLQRQINELQEKTRSL